MIKEFTMESSGVFGFTDTQEKRYCIEPDALRA